MESVGHECIGFCEIDKFARESYKSIFQTEGEIEFHDIRDVSDDEFKKLRGKVDVICGGFPCQAFSIAGRRLGFEDTRGTLFFEIARAAKQIQPRFLFLENVKGLLNHDKGRTFTTILTTLDELGFDVEWQVLNSKDFGVPQNRERVFIIGHLRGECTRRIFPLSSASKQVDKHQKLSTNTLTTRYPNSQGVGSYIIESESQRVSSIGNINKSGRGMNGEVYQADGLAPTLTTNKGEGQKIAIPVLTPDQSDKRQNGRRFKTDGEPMFTLTAQDRHGVLIKEATKKGYSEAEIGDSVNLSHPNSKTRRGRVGKQIANTLLTGESQGVVEPDFRIRKLTPRECWRLQGFPDWAFDKAQEVNSNSQLYKQAGNSVTVNVIAVIAKELK